MEFGGTITLMTSIEEAVCKHGNRIARNKQ